MKPVTKYAVEVPCADSISEASCLPPHDKSDWLACSEN